MLAGKKKLVWEAILDAEARAQVLKKMHKAQSRIKKRKLLFLKEKNIEHRDFLSINKHKLNNFASLQAIELQRKVATRENNLEQTKIRKSLQEEVQRREVLLDNDRWNDFKQRRAVQLNKFVAKKALQRGVEQLRVVMFLVLRMKGVAEYFEWYKKKLTIQMLVNFAMFRIKFMWKRRKLAYRGFDNMLMSNAKHTLTFLSPSLIDLQEKKALNSVLIPFLKEWSYRELFKIKIIKCRECLVFIQSKFLSHRALT